MTTYIPQMESIAFIFLLSPHSITPTVGEESQQTHLVTAAEKACPPSSHMPSVEMPSVEMVKGGLLKGICVQELKVCGPGCYSR